MSGTLTVMAGAQPLSYETGSQTIYSDLGYILLARLIENLTGRRLDAAFYERPREEQQTHLATLEAAKTEAEQLAERWAELEAKAEA